MKFKLQIPCPFPRLRFSVYDMETLSSDESLGERVISFMKSDHFFKNNFII